MFSHLKDKVKSWITSVIDYTEDPLDDVCSYGNRNSIPKNEADTTELNCKIEEDLTYEDDKENILPVNVTTLGNILYATATELGATATELGTKILKTVEKKSLFARIQSGTRSFR